MYSISIMCGSILMMCSNLWAEPSSGKLAKPPATRPSASGNMVLYISNAGAGTISQYRIGSGGGLQPLSPPTVPAGGGYIDRLIIDRSRHFAYGLDKSSANAVFQYRIASDGRLTPLSPPSLPVGKGDEGNIYLTPDGRFAYCPNTDDNTLSQFAVRPDGALKPLSPPVVPSGKGPIALLATPDSKYLYCADYEGNTLFTYRIQADGQLAQSGAPVALPAQPIVFSFFPNSQTLYCVNVSPGSISQFHVGADGRLSELAPVVSLPAQNLSALALHPATRSAYVTDSGQRLFQYHVSADGSLSPLSPTEIDLPGGPGSQIAISDTGGTTTGTRGNAFLYTNLQSNYEISQYRIAADGTLSALPKREAENPDGAPESLAVDPTGRFLYVVNDRPGMISQYRITGTGQLAPLSPSAVAAGGSSTFITIVTLPASSPHRRK